MTSGVFSCKFLCILVREEISLFINIGNIEFLQLWNKVSDCKNYAYKVAVMEIQYNWSFLMDLYLLW
jgi:hypothetical protein